LATSEGVGSSAGTSANAFIAEAVASAEFASSAVAAVTFVGFALDASGITRVYLDCCGDKENDVFVIK